MPTSAMVRITDSSQTSRHVRKVPTCDINIVRCANKKPPEGGLPNEQWIKRRGFSRSLRRATGTRRHGPPSGLALLVARPLARRFCLLHSFPHLCLDRVEIETRATLHRRV